MTERFTDFKMEAEQKSKPKWMDPKHTRKRKEEGKACKTDCARVFSLALLQDTHHGLQLCRLGGTVQSVMTIHLDAASTRIK